MPQKVILLGLNEINFEFVNYYCNQGLLPNFKKYIDRGWSLTTSESEYRLFEPWIQWVTVYTGKSYADHQVFRLGDITDRKDLSQIFEELEAENLTVAAVSPFNADNRLKKSPFFVPDPWTNTHTSGSELLQELSGAIKQAVNDNAQSKMSLASVISILRGFLRYVPLRRYSSYVALLAAIRKPGVKAMVLDNLLADAFVAQWKKFKPDFSNLFLNAGAHIQHHYLFNSAAYKGSITNPEWYCPAGYDPVRKVLEQYDSILAALDEFGATVFLATALHQRPHEKVTYYWRLKNHAEFAKKIGLTRYTQILPRMSRDFLIAFETSAEADAATQLLQSFSMKGDNQQIFEVDNRGNSLFVELVYPENLTDESTITNGTIDIEHFKQDVAFVAIKNGEHDGNGYLLCNQPMTNGTKPLSEVYNILKRSCLN
jgi:hypothetical protein